MDDLSLRFLLAGGPGAGKTTTLEVLRSRGFVCHDDAARSLIRSRLEAGLSARPQPPEFAEILLNSTIEQYDRAVDQGWPIFFDFSIVESAMMMQECGLLTDVQVIEHLRRRPYNRTVFFFPPWEEIFVQDSERDQTYPESLHVSTSLRNGLVSLGFHLVTIQPASPEERADVILANVDGQQL